jgi:putative nucleotidyltransferase with HDIG domain
MIGQEKIFLLGENLKQRVNLKRFLMGLSLDISDAKTLTETANQLLKTHDYTLAIFAFFPLESAKINFLSEIRAANPKMGIILLSTRENPKLGIALLDQGIVDQISSQENLPAVYSAIINEFRKREILNKNESFSKKLISLKSEQEKNLKRAMDLEEIYDSTLENLMTALDMRDVETFGHSRTVAKYSQMLARILKITEKTRLDNIRKGALLHDVGKIAIPDSILKKPSPLDHNEWEKIKLHPSLGYGLVKEIKLLKEVGNIIRLSQRIKKRRDSPRGTNICSGRCPGCHNILPALPGAEGLQNSEERDFGQHRPPVRSSGCRGVLLPGS